MIPIMTDDVLDTYLNEVATEQLQIFSIRKCGTIPSNANRTVESEYIKMKGIGSSSQNINVFIYSLSEADDICQISILEAR